MKYAFKTFDEFDEQNERLRKQLYKKSYIKIRDIQYVRDPDLHRVDLMVKYYDSRFDGTDEATLSDILDWVSYGEVYVDTGKMLIKEYIEKETEMHESEELNRKCASELRQISSDKFSEVNDYLLSNKLGKAVRIIRFSKNKNKVFTMQYMVDDEVILKDASAEDLIDALCEEKIRIFDLKDSLSELKYSIEE